MLVFISLRRSAKVLSFHPPDRLADEGGGVRQLEFFLDVEAMDFDRLHAQMEMLGNLARPPALADQLEDLEFAISQAAE